MVPPVPRLHLFEINDQPWFPGFLRARVQAALTFFWNFYVPLVQPSAPSTLVSSQLLRLLGPSTANYTFVDFCAGAGGPTPAIEQALNEQLGAAPLPGPSNSQSSVTGTEKSARSPSLGNTAIDVATGVDFVLTDIAPHPAAWARASELSSRLHYVASSIDASAAPTDLLSARTTLSPKASIGTTSARLASRPPFRLFFLAFHHFDNELAKAILRDALKHSDGFGIFELQDRSIGGLFTVLLLGPVMWATTWLYFWNDPVMLFWTYIIPVVPFVVVFDGIISCLRTRTASEIKKLIDECRVDLSGNKWRLRDGTECHTWPGGNMSWFLGVRE